ncbi:MAG: hypothetical protein AB2L20_09545 [Mangrovibacterium sp.]
MQVIQKACSKPEGGYTNWSQQRIAKEVGISQSRVFQILKEADLKPHKIEYWCGKSLDPEFETKMVTIDRTALTAFTKRQSKTIDG